MADVTIRRIRVDSGGGEGLKIDLEMLVNGLRNAQGIISVTEKGKTPVDAVMAALSKTFGYSASDWSVDWKTKSDGHQGRGFLTVIDPATGKQYSGSAAIISDLEVLEAVFPAYFNAVAQIEGTNVNVDVLC